MVIPSDQQLLLDLLANPNLSEQDRKLLAFELKQKIRSERNRYRLQLIKDAAPDKKIVVLDRETLELLKESRQSEEKDLSARGLATNLREDIKGSNDNLQSAGQQNVSGREPHSSSAVSGLSHNTGHAAKPPGQSLKSFEELHPRRVVQACNFDVSVLGSSQTAKPLTTGPAPAAQLRKKVEEQEVNVVDRSGDESAQDTLKSNHDMDFSEAINRKIPTDPRGPSDVRDASTKHAQKGHKKKDDNRVRRSSGLQNRDNPDRISFSDETVWLERLVTKALEKQKKHDEEIKRKEKHPDLFSPPPKGGHPGLPVLVATPPDNRLPVDVVDNCSTERKAHAPDEIVFSSSENVLEENIALDDRKAWLEDLVRAASPLPGSTLKSPKSLNGQTNPLEILRRSEHEKQSIKTPPLLEETLLSKQDVPVNAENPSLAEPNSSLDANFNERKPKPVPLQPAKTTTHKDETFDLQRFLANKTHASSPSTEQGDRLSNSSRSSKKENFTIPENSVDAEPEAFASDADNPDIETHSMTSSEKIRNWRVDDRSSTPDIDLDEETLPTYQIPNIKDKIVVFQNAGEEVTQRRHTLSEGKAKLNLKPVATTSFLNDIYIGKDFDLTPKGGKQASGTVKQAKGAPQQTVGDEKAQEKAPFSLDMVSQWRIEESRDALRKLGASLLGKVEDNPLNNPVSSQTRTAQDLVDAPGQGRATHAVRNENQVVSACAIQDERIQREVAEIQEREAELRKRRQSWGALASSTKTTTIPSSLVASAALPSESDAMAAAPDVRDRDGTESVSSSSSSDSAPVRIFGKKMNTLRRLVGLQKDVVRIVRLTGSIQASKGGMPSKQQLNIQVMEKSLDKAFDVKKVKPKAVLLEVNSPGGVPAQCNMIFTRIRNLSEKNGIPVVTYVEDMAVSGGYWLALAGDEIYAEPNAMVGSIGAIFGMFGMMELFNKLGLELRLFTAGENKLRFDPSKPLKAKDVIWAENLLREVHENFISLVKERRPSLDVNHKTVFTGDVFTAKSAQKFGLVDHLTSDIRTVMQSKYGKDITFERIARISSWKEMLRPSASVEVDFDAQAMLASVQRNARLPQF